MGQAKTIHAILIVQVGTQPNHSKPNAWKFRLQKHVVIIFERTGNVARLMVSRLQYLSVALTPITTLSTNCNEQALSHVHFLEKAQRTRGFFQALDVPYR